jgi:hypothetical protein
MVGPSLHDALPVATTGSRAMMPVVGAMDQRLSIHGHASSKGLPGSLRGQEAATSGSATPRHE